MIAFNGRAFVIMQSRQVDEKLEVVDNDVLNSSRNYLLSDCLKFWNQSPLKSDIYIYITFAISVTVLSRNSSVFITIKSPLVRSNLSSHISTEGWFSTRCRGNLKSCFDCKKGKFQTWESANIGGARESKNDKLDAIVIRSSSG